MCQQKATRRHVAEDGAAEDAKRGSAAKACSESLCLNKTVILSNLLADMIGPYPAI